MNKPDDQLQFAFFIHNKDQMYLIKQDGAFGSYYFSKNDYSYIL